MAVRTLSVELNIHKKRKYLKGQGDSPPDPQKLQILLKPPKDPVERLARALRSAGPVGTVLRTLVRRLRNPQTPYSDHDLEQLMLLSLADLRNEERP